MSVIPKPFSSYLVDKPLPLMPYAVDQGWVVATQGEDGQLYTVLPFSPGTPYSNCKEAIAAALTFAELDRNFSLSDSAAQICG